MGERKYSTGYEKSHPGDHGNFFVAIIVIIILAIIAYSQMGN